MIIGTFVNARMLPARFIEANTGVLWNFSRLNQSYKSTKSPSLDSLSAICWQIPSSALMHGSIWLSQKMCPANPTKRMASSTPGQRLLQTPGKSLGAQTAAARTIIGGPKATRRRFTKQPRSRNSSDCTTKKRRAASSPSSAKGFTSSTVSLDLDLLSMWASPLRCLRTPVLEGVSLDSLLLDWMEILGAGDKQFPKARPKTKRQVQAAAGAAVDSR